MTEDQKEDIIMYALIAFNSLLIGACAGAAVYAAILMTA